MTDLSNMTREQLQELAAQRVVKADQIKQIAKRVMEGEKK